MFSNMFLKIITKKTMWGNNISIHSVLKKILLFNQLNIKKIKLTKTILKEKKSTIAIYSKMWGKL
jgi:hypothetical protein